MRGVRRYFTLEGHGYVDTELCNVICILSFTLEVDLHRTKKELSSNRQMTIGSHSHSRHWYFIWL